jgi:hypothetical protein
MLKRTLLCILLAGSCGLMAVAQAQQFIYKWTDEQGQPKYSELPPPAGVRYETVRKSSGLEPGVAAKDLAKEQAELAKKLAEEELKLSRAAGTGAEGSRMMLRAKNCEVAKKNVRCCRATGQWSRPTTKATKWRSTPSSARPSCKRPKRPGLFLQSLISRSQGRFMRVSRFPLFTVKETPADAEVVSHQLMLRAGLIRKLAAGIYTWLPLGLRVLRKVEAVVREEMDRAGALELFMPAVQPAELWQESGRWQKYGPELLRIKDRHERDFCFGPTHEEVITDLFRREIKSYKQLPVNFYQIQTKFRDEVRPRFGVMRAREFLMKDAYSFHLDQASLQETYDVMYDAYTRIFSRLGLKFRAVLADTGSIGGAHSHEFHVLAESGEDAIAFSTAATTPPTSSWPRRWPRPASDPRRAKR